MMLIPAIDLRGGRCVRLKKGDFAAEMHYEAAPHELLLRYRALGATWLHVIDLDGARDGIRANRTAIAALASQRAVRLQVGGGVRSTAVIDDLLAHGVARVIVGSTAIESPDTVGAWIARYGAERLVVALDVRLDAHGVPEVLTRGWTRGSGVSLWSALGRFREWGLVHVLCTDADRDGALEGPNVALYREAVERFPELAWQASGGVRDAADLAALARTGVPAAVSGRALLEERVSPEELQPFLPGESSPASTSATGAS